MDHTASLPFLIENTFGCNDEPISIYSTKRVLAKVRNHLFNNDTWPDFTRLPNSLYPAVRFVEIKANEPFVISDLPTGELEVTPIPDVNEIDFGALGSDKTDDEPQENQPGREEPTEPDALDSFTKQSEGDSGVRPNTKE